MLLPFPLVKDFVKEVAAPSLSKKWPAYPWLLATLLTGVWCVVLFGLGRRLRRQFSRLKRSWCIKRFLGRLRATKEPVEVLERGVRDLRSQGRYTAAYHTRTCTLWALFKSACPFFKEDEEFLMVSAWEPSLAVANERYKELLKCFQRIDELIEGPKPPKEVVLRVDEHLRLLSTRLEDLEAAL